MKGDQQGFTLIEVLLVSAIFSIVVVAIYLTYITHHRTFAWGENKIEVQQNARIAMELMARELRMAGYDPSNVIPSCVPATAVQAAGPNGITFIADVTNDAPTPVSDAVTYRLAGSQLIRDFASWSGTGCAWSPSPPSSSEVAETISALAFRYFDANDAEIPSPVAAGSLGSIRRITISVTTEQTAAGKQETFLLSMDVKLRNP